MGWLKPKIIGLFIIFILLIIGVGVLIWLNGSQDLVVNFDNSNKVSIYNEKDYSDKKLDSPVIAITRNGQKVRLLKANYVVTYEGKQDYNNGKISVKVGDKPSHVTIKPSYSQKKLDSLLKNEFPSIKTAIETQYPVITTLYNIQRGALYSKGEWYGTSLQYRGENYSKSDTLKLVMHKESGIWKIKTKPPNIYLSKYVYTNIPVNILDDLNNFTHTPMLEKFVHPDTSHGPDGQ
jgi:hypothetical protein